MQKNIAVCGAPVVGKISLVLQLYKMIHGDSRPPGEIHANFYRRLFQIPITHRDVTFYFKCIPGAYWDPFDNPTEFITIDCTQGYALYGPTSSLSAAKGLMNPFDEIYTPLLSDADVVLYVIASGLDRSDPQLKWFQRYQSATQRLQKGWVDIPWIFILNKVDISTENPLGTYLPVQGENEILHTIGVGDGSNIDKLWNRILHRTQP